MIYYIIIRFLNKSSKNYQGDKIMNKFNTLYKKILEEDAVGYTRELSDYDLKLEELEKAMKAKNKEQLYAAVVSNLYRMDEKLFNKVLDDAIKYYNKRYGIK